MKPHEVFDALLFAIAFCTICVAGAAYAGYVLSSILERSGVLR